MNELTTTQSTPPQVISPFSGGDAFEAAKKMATMLSESSMLPVAYQGPKGVGNCMIALELSARLGVSVFTVTQNMDVIHGRPGFKATYLIGTINSSRKFSPLRFEYSGAPGTDARACRALATDKATGELLEGTMVSIKMAKAEGWYGRSGSKWPNMSEQMLMYRAASFWQRIYCPEVSLGLQSKEEVEDFVEVETVPETPKVRKRSVPAADAAPATETATQPEVIQEAVEVSVQATTETVGTTVAPEPTAAPSVAPAAPAAPPVDDGTTQVREEVTTKFKAAGLSWKDVKRLAVDSEWWDNADTLTFAQLPKEALEFLNARVDRISRTLARQKAAAEAPEQPEDTAPATSSDPSPV